MRYIVWIVISILFFWDFGVILRREGILDFFILMYIDGRLWVFLV